MVISDASIVVRSVEPLVASVDGEIVMLQPDLGEYFGLNAVGSRVWELIGSPRSVVEVCAVIAAEYEVDDETCGADTRSFLQDLAVAGLIEVRR